ncbi:MAG: metallophosphoesterase [Wenzhouxiangellaceae bacterium]
MEKTPDSTVFSWVQFSDPHFTEPQPSVRQLLSKRLLGYLSWRRRRRHVHRREVLDLAVADARSLNPDHWLITGDLTHIGLPAEFQQARQWLEGLGSPRDVSVIPGNHECYARSSWELTQATWLRWMSSDHNERTSRVGQAYFPYIRRRGPVAFIGLSTALPTPPFMASGRLGERQLQDLATALETTAAEGLLRVVLIHHPPQPGAVRPRKRLLDAAAFHQVVSEHGAELILHGHAHHWCQATLSGNGRSAVVLGPPSTTASGAAFGSAGGAGYFHFELEAQPGMWRLRSERRSYDAAAGAFRAVDENLWQLEHGGGGGPQRSG